MLALLALSQAGAMAPPAWPVAPPGPVPSGLPAESLDALPTTGRPVLREVTLDAGLGGWVHGGYLGSGNVTSSSFFTEFTGPGACWLDADGDAWLDLYLVSGVFQTHPWLNEVHRPRSTLFRNLGDGRFAELPEAAGARLTGTYQGCAAADYDNDGHADLAVLGWGGSVLLRNLGDGTFANATGAAGVRGRDCGPFPCWGSSASWLDYDRDGCLDLFVNHFTDYDPADPPEINGPGPGQVNRLWRNRCDGTFADATEAANLTGQKHDSWSSVAADYDADGWPDLYVSNDGDENDLYLNNGDGSFRRHMTVAADPRSSMGTAVADIDHDGDLDIVTTNFVGQFNGVYRDVGSDYDDLGDEAPFTDAEPWSGWAAHWHDMNNDGHLDLAVVNGMTEDTGVLPMPEPLLAYEGLDGGGFRSVRADLGDDALGTWVGRGGAWADYDNDGDVDFVLAEAGQAPTHLFRSDHGGGNFLAVDLVGTAPAVARDAIGARVEVRAAGLRPQALDRTAGSGFLGSNDPRLHFGLAHAEQADLTVTWPDGSTQSWAGLRANRFLRLTQGQAEAEVVRELPLVRIAGPGSAQRLEPASFRAEVAVPAGAGLASLRWDLGGEAEAEGAEASHGFRDVGAYVVRATATDTAGRSKTQAVRVLVTDQLSAEVAMDQPRYLPLDVARGNVTVRFSNGDPVRGAQVALAVRYSSGSPAADEAAARSLPRFARDLAGYVALEVAGSTDAAGRMAFTAPKSLTSPQPDVRFESYHAGQYRLLAAGGARGSTFPDAGGSFTVVASLADLPPTPG